MTNFIERSLLFILGLPLLIALIVFTAPYGHSGWAVLVIVCSFLGTRESYALFYADLEQPGRHRLLITLLGTLLLLAAYSDALFHPSPAFFPMSLITAIALLLLINLFAWNTYRSRGNFVRHSASDTAALLYPSAFAGYLILFTSFDSAHLVILLFLILNFGNDTFAYLAGKFLAPRKRDGQVPLLTVSPNKTLVGFLGGFFGALLTGFLFRTAFPGLLEGTLPAHLLFFLLLAALGNAGDLIESALKRSSSIKDSGNLVPGRGGILDSIDSLLFSAPFFYYSITIFFM